MDRDVLAKARRVALVAQNALLNGDLQRACSVLRDLQTATPTELDGRDRLQRPEVLRWRRTRRGRIEK